MKIHITILCLLIVNCMSVFGQNQIVQNGDTINRIDENGLRQGTWKFYDAMSSITVVTTIKNDVPDDSILYYKDGFLKFIYIKSQTDTTKYLLKEGDMICNGYFLQKSIHYCKDDSLSRKIIDVYIQFEIYPVFYGGDKSLNENIKKSAPKTTEKGKIKVSFNLDKAGRPTDIKIKESNNPKLEAQCLEVIRKMPRWQPGYQGGAIVSVPMIIPFTFN